MKKLSILTIFFLCVLASPSAKAEPSTHIPTKTKNEMLFVGSFGYTTHSQELYVFSDRKDDHCNSIKTTVKYAAGTGWSFGKVTSTTDIFLNHEKISISRLSSLNEREVIIYGKSHWLGDKKACDYIFILTR